MWSQDVVSCHSSEAKDSIEKLPISKLFGHDDVLLGKIIFHELMGVQVADPTIAEQHIFFQRVSVAHSERRHQLFLLGEFQHPQLVSPHTDFVLVGHDVSLGDEMASLTLTSAHPMVVKVIRHFFVLKLRSH